MEISGMDKAGSWVLANQKSSNYVDNFGPEIGCPEFYLSDVIRLIVIVGNGVKTALIVKKLAHRVMQ